MNQEVITEKRCTKCGEVKPVSEFNKDRGKRDGFGSHCKKCLKEISAKYRAENRDKIAKYRAENRDKIAEYRAKNHDKIAEYKAEYRAKNRDKIAEHKAEYYVKNRDKIAEYRAKNRDKIAESKAEYRAKNRDKIAEYRAEYRAEICEKLTDAYVKVLLTNQFGIRYKEIDENYPELIELKRKEVFHKRNLKNLTVNK